MPTDQAIPGEDFHFAVSHAVRIALSSASPEAFMDWMRRFGVRFFVEAIPEAHKTPQESWPALGALFGRAIWNHLPHPDHDYKPWKIPDPGRNDPCPCGSGRKYKQCCGGMPMSLPFTEDMLLPFVLEHLSKKEISALPQRRFSPELLAAIAHDWAEAGHEERARLLLEPMFKEVTALDGRHAAAFDTLMDIYLQLDKPRKRKALLEIGLQSNNAFLLGTALQRQAVMRIDAGDSAGAWASFNAALRASPDDPSMAILEISLLQSEGRGEQLVERARFWLMKLRRRPDAGEWSDLIAMLEGVHNNPEDFADRFTSQSLPHLAELEKLVAQLPAIKRHPKIERLDDGHGIVHDTLPEEAFEEWATVFDQNQPDKVHAWLSRHPAAWDSFDVLDDLVTLMRELDVPTDWLDRHILHPLFERVRQLVEAAFKGLPKPVQYLDWGWLENRAVNRLCFERAAWLTRNGQMDEAIAAFEQMLAWNPNDNLGVRDELARLYVGQGRHPEMLALAERYPGDSVQMQYHYVLTLFILGRNGEALSRLTEAAATYPKAIKMLLAEHPKPPKPDRYGIVIGGEYESWLYREQARQTWVQTGALDWMRTVASTLKPARY